MCDETKTTKKSNTWRLGFYGVFESIARGAMIGV
jgi:hypothetical protein